MRLEGILHRAGGAGGFVLGPIDFEGPDDRPWLVLGPSGSGKSTLLRILGGALRPGAGRVLGPDLCGESGYLPQLPERALAGRNLAEDLTGDVRPALAVRGELRAALHSVGLVDVPLSRRSRNLSLGERRRVMLALILLSGRRHWALDEPDAGLDLRGRDALVAWLRSRPAGDRLWIATHRWSLYRERNPLALVLFRGKLVAGGDLERVLGRGDVRELLAGGGGPSPS